MPARHVPAQYSPAQQYVPAAQYRPAQYVPARTRRPGARAHAQPLNDDLQPSTTKSLLAAIPKSLISQERDPNRALPDLTLKPSQ